MHLAPLPEPQEPLEWVGREVPAVTEVRQVEVVLVQTEVVQTALKEVREQVRLSEAHLAQTTHLP
jgi:hypothetical protein